MKVHISESQAKYIAESVFYDSALSSLPEFIGNNNLSKTGVFVGNVEKKLFKERENEVIGYFSDDITSYEKDKIFSDLSKLILKAKKKEENIREELEKICVNTVVKTFAIPEDSVRISSELVADIPPTKSFHVQPDTDEDYEYGEVSEIEAYDAETNKRRIINAISYGAAKNISEQSKKLWLGEVFELDETLPHLYSKIMKINDYLVFNTDIQITDKSHKQGGNVEIKLTGEDEISSVNAEAVLFPILLQETMRGIIDMISTFGLPEDKDTAKRVINAADALENDPVNMRLGPAMWNKIATCIHNFKTEEFPFFFRKLVEVNADDFISLMKEVLAGTRKGKEEIEKIYSSSKYENEYDRFKSDLALRQGKSIIDDDCFSDEEIESWGNE